MIHPQAIVDPKAKLAPDVEVGPWTIIGPDVEIDEGTVIGPHVVLRGPTKIGKFNKIFQFASVGEECQDKKYKGEPTRLEIGDRNIIRECVTIHRGTVQDKGLTKIGDDNLLMAYVHIGHDCVVGNHTVFANNAAIAGHVTVGDFVILGGFTNIHQFCQIGPYSMSSIATVIVKDVPAYLMVQGNNAKARGMNFEGMRRKNFSKDEIENLKQAYNIVYRQGVTLAEAMKDLKQKFKACEKTALFLTSLENSTRGITR